MELSKNVFFTKVLDSLSNRFPGPQGIQGIKGDKGLVGQKGEEGIDSTLISIGLGKNVTDFYLGNRKARQSRTARRARTSRIDRFNWTERS